MCDELVVVSRKDAEGPIWNDDQNNEIRASGRVVTIGVREGRVTHTIPREKEENKGIH